MMMPSTSEVTIFPKATPIITPTARSITFARAMNSLNSFSMMVSFDAKRLMTILRQRVPGFLSFVFVLESHATGLRHLVAGCTIGWIIALGPDIDNDFFFFGVEGCFDPRPDYVWRGVIGDANSRATADHRCEK